MRPSDFRSDTLTQPSPSMREAMAAAVVGDDVLDGDPTVGELESEAAAWLGKPGALFVPSGTDDGPRLCQLSDQRISHIKFDNNKKEVILKEKKSLYELLSRPDTNQEELYQPTSENKKHYQRACVEIRYAGYIKKQKREIEKNKKQNLKKIPESFSYDDISGLSNEVKEKLNKSKPNTIGSAARIEGVTPAAINIILVTMKKQELEKHNA